MPKQVDHDERRREIAGAVVRLAGKRGLAAVTFREVAAEAGVSVALVQHYFGSKQNLLLRTVDIVSIQVAERFTARIAALGPDARSIDRLRTLAVSFLPADETSRDAMVLYHSVGMVALTDPEMRGASAHGNAIALVALLAQLLTAARDAGEIDSDVDPPAEARLLSGALSGLSGAVLLDTMPLDDALGAIDAHLERLSAVRTASSARVGVTSTATPPQA